MNQLDHHTASGIAARAARAQSAPFVDSDAAASGPGRLPELSLASASGLLLLALANSLARGGGTWAQPLFWGGLLLLFAPIAARLIGPAAGRGERIGLVLLLAGALYGVKLLHSPLDFTFSDELQHWRTANDLLRHGMLFHANPLLPVSPLFPGLESATAALAQMGGLEIFTAGALLLGTARLVLALALFLFYERVSRSARVGGLAALLYMANPSYLFFGAQFAYESLALPFAALLLWAAARRTHAPPAERPGLTLVIVLALGALVITHHLTSYALIAFMALWSLIDTLRPAGHAAYARLLRWAAPPSARPTRHALADAPVALQSEELPPHGIALLALVLSLTWLAYAASQTVDYLGPPLRGALTAVVQLMAGETDGRELFRASTGELAPLWERATGFASVVLVLLGLPLGLWQIWRRLRSNPAALALAAGALAYPATLAMRLTERGAEAANRASEFLFVAIAFVLAVWVAQWAAGFRVQGSGVGDRGLDEGQPPASHTPNPTPRTLYPALVACAATIFIGGVIVGWAPWARLPGTYLPAADTRSIERQGLAAATWARNRLGPGNRLIADRTNRLLQGAYGEQRPVTSYSDQVKVALVYFAPEIGPSERKLLRRGQVRYVLIDQRLAGVLPSVAVYVERGEQAVRNYAAPLPPAALAKWDRLPGTSRLYDSGEIVIYDVGALSNEP